MQHRNITSFTRLNSRFRVSRHPNDPLLKKLKAISVAGFQAIELGFPDLVSFASSHHKRDNKEDDYENLCAPGVAVRRLCSTNKLDIMMLQPFPNFEG
jgi:sugar phosphate isomerase/epimerase